MQFQTEILSIFLTFSPACYISISPDSHCPFWPQSCSRKVASFYLQMEENNKFENTKIQLPRTNCKKKKNRRKENLIQYHARWVKSNNINIIPQQYKQNRTKKHRFRLPLTPFQLLILRRLLNILKTLFIV